MLGFLKKIFGTKAQRDLKKYLPILEEVNLQYKELEKLTNDELRNETLNIKIFIEGELALLNSEILAKKKKITDSQDDLSEVYKYQEQIDDLKKQINKQLELILNKKLPIVFAIVKETCRRFTKSSSIEVFANMHDIRFSKIRDYVTVKNSIATWKNSWDLLGTNITWNMIPYDVQVLGGIALHQGKIAEMATGEGKTLVSLFPVFLNALSGRSVHIVTVNDYLAQRDSQWMRPLFEFHGFNVDCIDIHPSSSVERKNAYAANIVYGTNNEFGFDYLRDNMATEINEVVQNQLYYAIVDEVDSVLIDDARTPLIISGPVQEDSQEEFSTMQPTIEAIVNAQKNLVKEHLQMAKKLISENKIPEGEIDLFRAYRGLPKYKPLIKYLSEQGIKKILTKVEHYYMQDNSRMMPEADEPLLFTIEERNNSVEFTQKGIDFITNLTKDATFFTLPNLPLLLKQIENDDTITTQERINRIEKIKIDYKNQSKRLHTIKQLLKAYTLFEIDVDYIKKNNKIYIVDEQTGRILEGRRYSDGLHQALEAKEKVRIQRSSQTYASITLQNYFRMYQKLAGMTATASTEAAEFWDIYKLDVIEIPTNKTVIREDKEDLVYKTAREKFNAVITEIVELQSKNRPVLVGTTSVETSELVSRMLNLKKIKHKVLNAKYHELEAEIIAQAGIAGSVTIATNMAGRGTDIKLSEGAKLAGGLAVVGTERHESRRVDRQLRGRAGRQGDVGSSQFFISLEDQLMRLFGSDRIVSIMDRIGLDEGEVIQHPIITKSIETAQKKVEQGNFATRKRLLEYDNVMNSQRTIIYRKRNKALSGSIVDIDIDLKSIIYETITKINDQCPNTILDNIAIAKINKIFNCTLEDYIDENQNEKTGNSLLNNIYFKIIELYQTQKSAMIEIISKKILSATDNKSITFLTKKNSIINIPIKNYEGLDLETAALTIINKFEKNIMLNTIDEYWKQHLHAMDDLKQTVQNVIYERRDPILVYKIESFDLFQSFMLNVYNNVLENLFHTIIIEHPSESIDFQKHISSVKTESLNSKAMLNNISNKQKINQELNINHKESTSHLFGNYNRNDKVNVKYEDGSEKINVKFKMVEKDLIEKRCCIKQDDQNNKENLKKKSENIDIASN